MGKVLDFLTFGEIRRRRVVYRDFGADLCDLDDRQVLDLVQAAEQKAFEDCQARDLLGAAWRFDRHLHHEVVHLMNLASASQQRAERMRMAHDLLLSPTGD